MSRMTRSRFPITLWPGTPVAELLIDRCKVVPLEDDTMLITGERVPAAMLPPEFVLRELLDLSLPVDDIGEVASFLTEWGMVPLAGSVYGPAKAGESRTLTLPHATGYLSVAQRLVRHWLAWSWDEDEREVWRGDPFYNEWIPGDASASQLGQSYDPREWALWEAENGRKFAEPRWWFAQRINGSTAPNSRRSDWGLGSYTMRAEFPDPVGYQAGEEPYWFGVPTSDLFSACCVQLSNLINSGLEPRRCESETCRRPFVLQHGGAEHGQHRTKGVKYCSPECQKAQAQREWRRRQKSTSGRGA